VPSSQSSQTALLRWFLGPHRSPRHLPIPHGIGTASRHDALGSFSRFLNC